MEQLDKGIGWLQKLLNLQKRYGFFSIIKGLFLLFLSGYIIFFALNPKYLLDRMSEITTAQHDHLVNTRLSADSNIRHILSKMIFTTNADRAWLIEFHNGSKNLTTGLPFLFGSMRIEEVRDSISNVDEDYADFSLSKYKLVAKVLDDGYFYGGLDDIQKIDQRLYYKFQANDISEIALLTLYDGEKPAGIIGLSFCNGKKMDKQLVGKHIRSSGISVFYIFQNIPRLTVKGLTNTVQSADLNSLCLAIFQHGNICHGNTDPFRELCHTHLPFRQHDIDIDNN